MQAASQNWQTGSSSNKLKTTRFVRFVKPIVDDFILP